MQKFVTAFAIALAGWMLFWSYELSDRSETLIVKHALIANEFASVEVPEEGVTPAQRAEITKQIFESRREMSQFARETIDVAREDVDHARIMLLNLSLWAFVLLSLSVAVSFVSRYRLKVVRRSEGEGHIHQEDGSPNVATV